MSVVVDSSYALACFMPDEKQPVSMQAVLGESMHVPFTWPVEIANAMRTAVRRKRFGPDEAVSFARQLGELGARVAPPWHDDASRYLELALAHNLTPYDALYLDLCLSEHCDLASCDRELLQAAARIGIRTHN